jgi:hypothetical protein
MESPPKLEDPFKQNDRSQIQFFKKIIVFRKQYPLQLAQEEFEMIAEHHYKI